MGVLDIFYRNIGGKLKSWAKGIFFVEALAAIIAGIVIIAGDSDSLGIGLSVIVAGPLVALVSTWILYAFGQLVENSDHIYQVLKKRDEQVEEPVKSEEPIFVKREEPKIVNLEGKAAKTVYCPKCGKSQFDGRSTCFSCGAPLK